MSLHSSKRTFFELEWLCLLLSFIPVFFIVTSDPNAAELWTSSFTRVYNALLGPLVKYIPFSITEIIVVSLVILLVIIIVLLIIDLVKKQYKKVGHKSISIVLIGLSTFILFYSTMGVGYYRLPVDIPQYNNEVSTADYLGIYNHFTDDFNYCADNLTFNENGEVNNPYTNEQLNKIIEQEYAKLNSSYFFSFTTYAKPMMSSYLYREFNITGLTFSPLCESNIDYLMTNAEYPFTFAHEIAHSKGVMREEDAQLTALYITLNSDDIYLRYSGYTYSYYAIRNIYNYLSTAKKAEASKINAKINKNSDYIYKYWQTHDMLEHIATFFNNLYLSVNNNSGVTSYDDPPETSTNEGTEEEPEWVITSFSPYQKLFLWMYFK